MDAIHKKYLRMDKLPHIWCPGCGNGTIMSAFIRAVDRLGYDKNDVAAVSGIGCSGRITGYLDFNTLHTTHGRALAFATGIKMAKPRLKVFVFMGDGDATAIGGNHLIHACRRNIDITTIIFNNHIYGMTGGQFSPTTFRDKYATTAPYGTTDPPFDIAKLCIGAGASYVARGTSYHAKMLTDLIVAGAEHRGFSVIEIITHCPVNFGRRNELETPVDMLLWQKNHAVRAARAEKMSESELEGKFVIGELHRADIPEYVEAYDQMIERVRKGATGRG
jgi:2-oxoglutarate ferredoxin oxidoreductase subunit beta